jgi:hypothetical protein
LTSFLGGPTGPDKASAARTTEMKAIRRYRMMIAPDGKAGDPVVRYRSGPYRKIRRQPDGAYFFRPRPGIKTHLRHFLAPRPRNRVSTAPATARASQPSYALLDAMHHGPVDPSLASTQLLERRGAPLCQAANSSPPIGSRGTDLDGIGGSGATAAIHRVGRAGPPNRKGPPAPKRVRQSVQMLSTRRTSAAASA